VMIETEILYNGNAINFSPTHTATPRQLNSIPTYRCLCCVCVVLCTTQQNTLE